MTQKDVMSKIYFRIFCAKKMQKKEQKLTGFEEGEKVGSRIRLRLLVNQELSAYHEDC